MESMQYIPYVTRGTAASSLPPSLPPPQQLRHICWAASAPRTAPSPIGWSPSAANGLSGEAATETTSSRSSIPGSSQSRAAGPIRFHALDPGQLVEPEQNGFNFLQK
ncbi:hypothetical protein INR49_032376 [Caranx melampygus]|nr:hypothetical protein INR49_032376 [Caranx melampygus]